MNRLIQLAFDWFSPEVQPAAQAPTPPPSSVPSSPRRGEPVSELAFAHPRANRRACLMQTWVAYEFKRARRRTIGFLVDADGLVVRAPNWVTIAEMESALQEKAAWVLRKLQEAQEQQRRLSRTRIEWRDGATLPYLGGALQLRLDPARSQMAHAALLEGAGELCLGLSLNATPEQIRDAVQAWLMAQARQIFTERLDHFAPRLGVTWRKLMLSQAGTRWGSACADGTIRLNWRLVHFKPDLIDYVVAHELSHLREMNHSAAFWDTVKTVVPDYPDKRQSLRQALVPVW